MRGGVEWLKKAQGKAECCMYHEIPPQVLYFIIQHEYMVFLLICCLCVGGLIPSALMLDLGEGIHKMLNKLTKPVVNLLLLPNQLEITNIQVL